MRQPTSLRSLLLLLIAGSTLPLLVLSLVFGAILVRHERDVVRSSAMDRNRALTTAIDAEVRGHIATLQALSVSSALTRDDLAAFDGQARRILATQPAWRNLLLLAPSGQQLTNTRYPYGMPLPMTVDTDNFARAVSTARPVVGNLTQASQGAFWGVPVRLPIVREGRVVYVLECILDPAFITQLIRKQKYPPEWTIGIADTHARIISRLPERPPGEVLPAATWDTLQRSSEGWFLARTMEGNSSYSAFARSPFTDWTVGTSIPASEVSAAGWHAAGLLGSGALLSLALAALLAWVLGRRVAEPISAIASAARDIGKGPARGLEQVRRSARLREVLEVADALEEAAASIAERENLRQREQEALRAADKAKDEFLAMLGHELRNPLSAITASAHVLRLSQPGAENATRAHAVIDRQARQMTRLVEDLLDVSRLAMGKLTLQPERLDLAVLVAHVVRTWRGARPERSERSMTIELASAVVDADRARTEQIVVNLLDNAEKFSDVHTPITVRVTAEGGWAQLEVRDRGQGIPVDELAHVFELFVQGEQTFDRPQGGIGLGLALVQRLAELQGGKVAAASAGRGKGATFSVRLPLAVAAAPAPAPESAQAPASGPARRVLLVEDNPDGREVLQAMLVLEGHTVRSEATGEAGVAAAQEFAPDIGLVDIGLPGIDGYEVARRIRRLPLPIQPRLIAISGYGQPRDQQLAYEAGFDLHLTKPVAPEFLRSVFSALTQRDSVRA